MDDIQAALAGADRHIYIPKVFQSFGCCTRLSVDEASEFCRLLLEWDGVGWNSVQAAVWLYEWSGASLIRAEWTPYRDVAVTALMLYHQLPLQVNLPDDLGQLAFKVFHKMKGEENEGDGPKTKTGVVFSWSIPAVEANPLLKTCLDRGMKPIASQERQELSTQAPNIIELTEAPLNNAQKVPIDDNRKKIWYNDVVLIQRTLAQLLMAVEEDTEDEAVLIVCNAMVLLQSLKQSIHNSRMMAVHKATVPHAKEVLFGKQELQLIQTQNTLQGKLTRQFPYRGKGKGSFGKGKGKGKSGWRHYWKPDQYWKPGWKAPWKSEWKSKEPPPKDG